MLARDSGSRGFSVANALEIGVDESIFVDYLQNELWAAYFMYSNGKENEIELVITDEQPWIPKTFNELCDDFPFWSVKQIRRIVHSCKEQGAIQTDRYNQSPMERRLWYTVKGAKIK